ncbi:E3 ubiquitin-protein ligase TRIM39-like [Onychostoma macrolepis]|uniref:E3 ubiquitin-protein ligase TRIM39-like n=1 Tax=Onychostoma macrolepis TaxID=369639 RepID=UPI00272AF549|nr:E3 ubiquitin-protein ligase TRIM39-like [Onychostoma macrolepis]
MMEGFSVLEECLTVVEQTRCSLSTAGQPSLSQTLNWSHVQCPSELESYKKVGLMYRPLSLQIVRRELWRNWKTKISNLVSDFWTSLFNLQTITNTIFYRRLLERNVNQIVEEDMTIKELRQHAVEISIDRERLHPDLKVCKDCKTMRDGPEYNHTGEGFPYELCAFGAQRFTSGRHYWEVDLTRDNTPPKHYWLIGVVKEGSSASKHRSAVTASAGFWFLCSDGPHGFYSNTDQSIILSLTPRPERLGVLLDYDDGQLSFYNVTERKHLLTISSRFSGSVVPLFNPGVGDESPLTILDCPEPVESAAESIQPFLSNNSSDA